MQRATRYSELAAPPPGWFELGALRDCFPATTAAAASRAAQRWASGLAAHQRQRIGRTHLVAAAARLPDGTTVEAALRCPVDRHGPALPPGHEHWTQADRHRFSANLALIAAWDEIRSRPTVRSDADALALLAVEQRAAAQAANIRLSRTSFWRLRRRMDSRSPDFDGGIDRRGRGTGRVAELSPDAWERFLDLTLTENRIALAKAWQVVAAEAPEFGWTWPSLRVVRSRFEQLPTAAKIRGRRGAWQAEADCVPKVERSVDEIAAGAWWCLDGRISDVMIRVPDARREWRRARAVLTGVLDVRSRSLVLDVRSSESADGILAGIAAALHAWGAPEHVIADNGEAYKAAVGSRRGSVRQRTIFADARIGSVFALVGAEVHASIPYHSWAKPIESIWRKLKDDFDRWFWSYWGGSADDRPSDAEQQTRCLIDQLPTLDEYRAALDSWLAIYHAQTSSGRGMRGLSPSDVMAHYRAALRRVDPELVRFAASRSVGPVRVGRDGIRHNNLLYRLDASDLIPLQGRDVWLRIDPDDATALTVCAADGEHCGAPLCIARTRGLADATTEDLRDALREQQRARRIIAEYARARDTQLTPTPVQVLKARKRRVEAEQVERRKSLPTPADPPVRIVRPDLTAAVRRLSQGRKVAKSQSSDLPTCRPADSDCGMGFQPVSPFELLADAPDDARRSIPATLDWAQLYEQEDEHDTHAGAAG